MLLVVTYDVDTTNPAGARRLHRVAKICERYGVRVQNSVFEILVDAAQSVLLKADLEQEIDPKSDSVRFYTIGNAYQHKIEAIGKQSTVQTGKPLMF